MMCDCEGQFGQSAVLYTVTDTWLDLLNMKRCAVK
jgi:hypothetical protein